MDRGARAEAQSLLARDPVANLFLIDIASRLGEPPAAGEAPCEMVGAWCDGELVAVGSLRPSIAFSAAPPEVLAAFLPFLEPIGVGLMKCAAATVDTLWRDLGRNRNRRVVLDRLETAYVVREPEARLAPVRECERVRDASLEDLEPLVVAARESLREEHRPDPFAGDIRGFKRWVRGRVPRARVVESGGIITCVGYADVRLPAGWLLQGVYCWPEVRRRGFATTAVSDLCREAFEAGAEHVQLAVVEGNAAAHRLYTRLGFRSCGSLRTILFA
jgi:RimJ/RimL family protein N-acetyltransferase